MLNPVPDLELQADLPSRLIKRITEYVMGYYWGYGYTLASPANPASRDQLAEAEALETTLHQLAWLRISSGELEMAEEPLV